MKIYCSGSGTTNYETRTYSGVDTFIQCAVCGRVLKPTPRTRVLRQHQPRNRNTASLDNTRDILWEAAGRSHVVGFDPATPLSEPVVFGVDRKGTEIVFRLITRTDGIDAGEVQKLVNELYQVTKHGRTELVGAKWQISVLGGPSLLYSREGQM